MNKHLFTLMFLLNVVSLQTIWAIPFVSNTPINDIKSSIENFNIEQFREKIKESYNCHHINGSVSFDVDTELLKKCEHKTLDTERLYQIIHDFQELKKAVRDTREKSRAGYFYKGAAAAAAGVVMDLAVLYISIGTYDRWEAIKKDREEPIAAGVIGGLAGTSLPALYYARGQLSKAWNYEENRAKLLTIERDIQTIVVLIKERAAKYADDPTKKALDEFVKEMNSSKES